MVRLAFFLVVITVVMMAILPRRMATFTNFGQPYAALQQENYFRELKEVNRLKVEAPGHPELYKAMIAFGKTLWSLKRYAEADQQFSAVWEGRVKSGEAYDQLFVDACINLGGVRRDSAAFENAVACYRTVLDYETKRLPSNDARLVRDETNLGVVLFLQGKSEGNKSKRDALLAESVQHLKSAITLQHSLVPAGSVREGNIGQSLAYVYKSMDDKGSYNRELKAARNMQSLQKRSTKEP